MSDANVREGEYSGWRGGIGIAFGSPSRWIPDVMELGYEISWGVEDFPGEVSSLLGVAVYRYWNSIVEVTLKDPQGTYDFSRLADKEHAAVLAFDAWAEAQLGVKGLSRHATVTHRPEGSYGDVMGTMDYSSPNPLVDGLVATYLRWFSENGVATGGIALDNAGKVPRSFVETLRRTFTERGLGIATNGCPDELLPLVDFFGNEGFPFSIPRARDAREKGFRGILGEFTMQHLSSGELAAYLKAKLFNRIVFFGYTNGGTAAGAAHSFYARRPDVYDHQRWVFRRYVSLSRAVHRAGEQVASHARLAESGGRGPGDLVGAPGTRADGAVYEWNRKEDVEELMARSLGKPFVRRFGSSPGGVYLYVASNGEEDLCCDARELGVSAATVVWDEFGERLLPAKQDGGELRFRTPAGPALVQLGSRPAIARSMLERVEELFAMQLKQRALDRAGRLAHALEPWRGFCDGYAVDASVSRSGGSSLRLAGGERATFNGKFRYHGRQGAAQLVNLAQTRPLPLTLELWSRSEGVVKSEALTLRSWEERDLHFSAREGATYAAHLYLDYQDGSWPEITSASFSPGTHEWEKQSFTVYPAKPARTAMVLVELHQPAGTAWFDDLELCQADRPEDNLLVFPGFEADGALLELADRSSREYQGLVGRLVEGLARARSDPRATALRASLEEIARIRGWLQSKGLSRLWSYEWRDLEDATARLSRCTELLGT
jgi:hypothetical protein